MSNSGDIELHLGMNADEVTAAINRISQLSTQRIAELQRSGRGAASANIGIASSFGGEIGRTSAAIRGSSLDPAEQTRLISQMQRQSQTPFLQAAVGAPGSGASREALVKASRDAKQAELERYGVTQRTTAEITKQARQYGTLYNLNERLTKTFGVQAAEITKQARESGSLYNVNERLRKTFSGQTQEIDRFRNINQSIGQTFQTRAYVNEQASQKLQQQFLQSQVDAEVRARLLAGKAGDLSRTQQLQVRSGFLFGRQNLQGLPPTLGQIFGQSVATIGRFAAGGAAFYAVTKGISDTVKTAQQLEYTFNILNSQMIGLNQAGDLPQLKKSIFDIARETGLATDEVAQLATAFVGALGQSGAGAAATKIASEIAVVAQLKPGEIFNDLVAGMKAFAATPAPADQLKTLQQIGDLSIQLRNATGVAPKEIIDFLGRVGPIARTAGLSLNQAAAAAATLLQGSAVGGAALGEQFGRILTGFSKDATDIAELAQEFPALGISIQEAMSGTPAVLFKLAEGFKSLSQAQQQQLIQSLGSRREGQTLAVLFQNEATLTTATAAAETASGRTAAELAQRKKTLQLQVQQLTTSLQQLGLALYNAGIGDLLKEIVNIIREFAGVLNVLSGLLDHVPAQFVAFAAKAGLAIAALKAIQILSARGGGDGGGGGIPLVFGEEAAVASGGASLGTRLAVSLGLGARTASTADAVSGGIGGGLSSLLGGILSPTGLAIGGGLIAAKLIPEIMGSLRSGKGPIGSLRQQVNELQKTAAGVVVDSSTDLDELIKDAGGDIKNVSESKLKELSSQLIKPTGGFFGGKSVSKKNLESLKAIAEEVNRRREAKFAPLLAFLHDRGLIDDQAEKSLEEAFGGGRDSPEALTRLLTGGGGIDPTVFRGKINISGINALGAKNIAAGIKERAKERTAKFDAEQQSDIQFSDALAAFDDGNGSLAQLTDAWLRRKQIDDLAPKGSEAAKTAAKDLKDYNQRHDQSIQEYFDLQNDIADLGGQNTQSDKIARLRVEQTQLVDPKNRVKVAQEITKALQDQLKSMADQATSASEAQRILRDGIPIDIDTKASLIEGELVATGGAFQNFLAKYLESGLTVTNAMYGQISTFVASGKTVVEALKIVLEQELQGLQAAAYFGAQTLQYTNGVSTQFQAIQQLLDGLNSVADPNLGVGVPNKVTDTQGAADKQKQVNDEIAAAAKARLDYLAALVAGDPVKEAQVAQQQADLAFKQAKTEADRISATAARVRADRQLQDAIQAVTQSQIDLAIAYADSAGNTLEAAYIAELKAVQELEYLRSHGAGDEKINQAKAAVAQAHARTRDAGLQQKEDQIEFQHQMGQITDGQYVNLLKTLLTLPDLTEKEKDDILLKIHDIQKSLGGNLQFNLPTELGLPTLYESRRLDQQGGGYSDNRTVTVNVYPSAGMDEKAIASAVVQQFGAAPRVGVTPRIY